jgi:hypothetical protein
MAGTAQELMNQYNDWNNPQNPWVLFAQATEPTRKAQIFQQIQRDQSQIPDASGQYKSQFEATMALLRTKLSKSTTDFTKGIITVEDSSALTNVILGSIASQTNPLGFLAEFNRTLKPAAVSQPDMTTQFSKQVQSALQYKDLGDARQAYSDIYFKTWGQFPAVELDKKFQDAWNNEVKVQTQPTTTDTTTVKGYRYDTKSKPVIDKATGKQKIDEVGQKVFAKKLYKDKVPLVNTKSTGVSTTMGQGFTAEEQTQFLADFLVKNYPDTKFNVEDIGGTAKTIFDTIASYHKGNYEDTPDFATVAPLIKNILSHPDDKVQEEMFNQYVGDLQKKAGSRFMSVQGLLQPGENASKYINPILNAIGTALEKTIDVKDPLAIQALNFKDDKGNYRLPNDFELNSLVVNDKRYDSTSTAINTSVNMFQSLQNALR